MALVSVDLGATLKIGDPFGNNYAKLNVSIKDIDTSLNVEEQLIESYKALEATYQLVQKKLDAEIDELGIK